MYRVNHHTPGHSCTLVRDGVIVAEGGPFVSRREAEDFAIEAQRLLELEDTIVTACKAMQAKGVRITRKSSLVYSYDRAIERCCALVAASPPESYTAWLNETGATYHRAGARLGLTPDQVLMFVMGFDGHAGANEFYALGQRVAARILGGAS